MTEYGDRAPEYAFRFLTSDERTQILTAATPLSLEKGRELFRAGDPAGDIYFLETGKLAVLMRTGFKDRTQVIALLDPGAPVGEGGLLDDTYRTATVVAIEDSHLYGLKRQAVTALEEENPSLVSKIFKRLLYTANLRLQKSSERLAHVL